MGKMKFNNQPVMDKQPKKECEDRSHERAIKVVVGHKYKIKDGRYIGRLCYIVSYNAPTNFAIVKLCDAWGEPTNEKDAVNAVFLER